MLSRPPSAHPARFKGTTLIHLAPWIRETFTRTAITHAFDSLPAELAAHFDRERPDFGALPSAWYDSRVYTHIFDTLLPTLRNKNESQLAHDAAETVLNQTLRGIYKKLFSMMASPTLYARYAQKMWDTHYDTGVVEVDQRSPTVAHHRVRDWAGHHPFVCAINRQSGAFVYRMMGLSNVQIDSERCASLSCESVYSWDR